MFAGDHSALGKRHLAGQQADHAEVEQREVSGELQAKQPQAVFLLADAMQQKRRQEQANDRDEDQVHLAQPYAADDAAGPAHAARVRNARRLRN